MGALQGALFILRTGMPSKSDKQARMMQAAARNKEFAKKTGVPQKVAKEYAREDKKRGLMYARNK